jgi:hypothetical protein
VRWAQGHLPANEVSHPGPVCATLPKPGSLSITDAERGTYHVHGAKRFSFLGSLCIPVGPTQRSANHNAGADCHSERVAE